MKTIRNTKLYQELLEKTEWNTLFIFYENDAAELKDSEIPTFWGGLDHIETKGNGVYFYDIGSNGRDHSFVIRPEKRKNLEEG